MSTAQWLHLFISPHLFPFTLLSSDPESSGGQRRSRHPCSNSNFNMEKLFLNMILLLLEVGRTCCNAILWHRSASMWHSPSVVLRAVLSVADARHCSTASVAGAQRCRGV